MSTVIRALTSLDASAYRALRLRGLWEHPEAFLAEPDDEEARPTADVAARLAGLGEDDFVLGVFVDMRLVGVVGMTREPTAKLRHKAALWGHYIAPEHRRRGLARALLVAALRRARGTHGVECVVLDVMRDNAVARRLYVEAGFGSCGVECDALRVGDRSHDQERMILRFAPHS